MSDTLLQEVQADVAERMRADEVLGLVTIVTERSKDILGEISLALGVARSTAGSTGVCLVVMQIDGRAQSADIPFPVMEMDVVVRVMENPVLNTSGRSALTLARRVARVLWHYTPHALVAPFVPASALISPAEDPLAPVAYDVAFSTREAGFSDEQRVQMPSISPSDGVAPQTVTLACGTAGAEIWYTLDGSHPAPTNPAALLYSGAFQVSAAALLRAGAHAAGHIASHISAAQFD